jgi:transcription initiation factor TFIIIB Brf1 subunit/transcription initiation factor TFIIB
VRKRQMKIINRKKKGERERKVEKAVKQSDRISANLQAKTHHDKQAARLAQALLENFLPKIIQYTASEFLP